MHSQVLSQLLKGPSNVAAKCVLSFHEQQRIRRLDPSKSYVAQDLFRAGDKLSSTSGQLRCSAKAVTAERACDLGMENWKAVVKRDRPILARPFVGRQRRVGGIDHVGRGP